MVVTGILFIPVTALVSVVRPYRKTMYNVVDTVLFLALISLCFSIAVLPLSAFNWRHETFTSTMFGMSVVFPYLYVIVLVFKRIKWTTRAKKSLLCTKLCRDGKLFQRKEDAEDPLLHHTADSEGTEASLLVRRSVPYYNSLLGV